MPRPARNARPLRGCRATLRALAASCASLLLSSAAAQDANPTTASSALYVRVDSDRTTVVTPRLSVGAPLSDTTRVDLVYTVDVWTSASIDIRTSASKAVTELDDETIEVTEQRDEIDASLTHAFTDVTVSGVYRYSTEYDYESHGAGLSGAYDFADNNAQLALGLRAYFDRVGRAGDPGFDRPTEMLTGRASFLQVLDTQTLAQVVYELTRQTGYLSSPYRYVRIADDAGSIPSTCAYSDTMFEPRTLGGCPPENNPDARLRHAVALNARRALGQPFSVGASYRFYIDDWDMTSHTIAVDAALVPDDGWLLSLGYRFYHQGKASHFAPFYPAMPLPAHYTSDKELSTLSSHRIALEVARSWVLDAAGSEIGAVLRAAPAYFAYDDYLLLDQITALEVTLGLGVTL